MKRGPRPKSKVSTKWSEELAYAVGLLVADGYVSKDGRHITLTSKDKIQIENFKKCLGISTKVGQKFSGAGNLSYQTQFGDVNFYQFLLKIGVSPAKSKTISSVFIPKVFFFDFLCGYFDGDGCSYSYYDKVWKNSFRFYISFASGSEKYISWLRLKLKGLLGINGHISYSKNSSNLQLRYSKKEAVKIAKKMYYRESLMCLKRGNTPS